MADSLVLLPGMMCDARLFGPQTARFVPTFVADLTQSVSMRHLAQDVLRQVPFDRFALAGLSMGGIAAMEILTIAPERVLRLALLDTNHRAETEERRLLRAPQIARAKAGGLREVLMEEMKPNYLAPAQAKNRDLLDLVLAMGLDLGPETFERQSLALRDRPDYEAVLKTFRGPALVLCGRHDRLCPVSRHEEMAALIEGAELSVIEDSGHLSTLEAPEAVNSALERWLARSA